MARKTSHGLKMVRVKDHLGKTHYVPEGADLNALGIRSNTKHVITKSLSEEIVAHYSAGKSIVEIAKIPGMVPLSAIYCYMHTHKDFGVRMREAKKNRGIVHEERALEIAEKLGTRTRKDENGDEVPVMPSSEEVQAARLKVDVHKWAAGVNDPENYGNKTKIIGDPNQPISFVIETGFRPPQIEKKDDGTGES
jgi:hypothetical protein